MSNRGTGVPLRSGSITCALVRTDGTTAYYGGIMPAAMRMGVEQHMNGIAVLESVVRNNESHVFYPLLDVLRHAALLGIEPMIFVGLLRSDSTGASESNADTKNQTG